MSFFYDLNKKLDSIRATPALTHQQLNERDLGKHNNATTGFAALAKKTGGGEKGARIAGAQLAKMRAKGQVEEDMPISDPVGNGKYTPPKAGSQIQVTPYKSQPSLPSATKIPNMTNKLPSTGAGAGRGGQGGAGAPEPGMLDKIGTAVGSAASTANNEFWNVAKKGAAALDARGFSDNDHIINRQTNLPEAGDTPAGLAAVKKVGQRADRAIQDAGTGRSGSELANPGKTHAARDRANNIQKRERDKQNAQNPTRVVGGPNHGNQMEEDGGIPMTPKQKSFAKLAPPADKITFADRIAGAKKEVDEMLGNVAADAMKKAIGGGRGRNAEMDESGGHIDWSDDDRGRKLSSTGGRIDTSKPGVTRHTPVKGNYSGAGHDAHAGSDGPSGPAGRRRVGAGQGTKIGAKINTGKSKLMTREGDQDPADQGEYDQEGAMGRNEIHTMMRNAKQLEQMLGDNDNLPEWVQKKLSLASDYMQTIADYLASEKETDAEDQSGEEMELAEKKSVRSKPKQSSGNDGNLANNAPPYKKVTRRDVIQGAQGNDEMGGKKKSTKPSAKKEEEVEESTTAGSVATAPTSGKASKAGMSFGKGIYDSIDRAVERQINESMNISMSMNNEGGSAGQTLTITATDEDATQLAQMLKMAGLGGGDNMSHGEDDLADQIRQAEQGHGGAAFGGEEVCSGCGMSDCGCDEMVDETYGDNVVDMNSPNYPTNTERAQDNFGYSGGVNKPKHDVAGNGQSTVPVTAVRAQDELSRIREMAGMPPAMPVVNNRAVPSNTSAQKAQQKQNESIFTDTENLWKRYKG